MDLASVDLLLPDGYLLVSLLPRNRNLALNKDESHNKYEDEQGGRYHQEDAYSKYLVKDVREDYTEFRAIRQVPKCIAKSQLTEEILSGRETKTRKIVRAKGERASCCTSELLYPSRSPNTCSMA
jgi:hypothetical protein